MGSRVKFVSVVVSALVLSACGTACGPEIERATEGAGPSSAAVPNEGDEAPFRASTRAGRFEVAIRPEAGTPRIGALHAWIVEVRLPNGEPAAVRQLVFDGGMPAHGHGFETSPRVTDTLGPGSFRVDGVRFQMAGAWQIRVDVATEGIADTALFDVTVGP